MAGDQANSQRNIVKWCLVGVLGVVLMSVVGWKIFSAGGKPPAKDKSTKAAQRTERATRHAPRKFPAKNLPVTAAPTTPLKWPTISLAQAVAHDPFAPEVSPGTTTTASDALTDEVSRALEAQRAATLAETLQALRERGVTMVLHTADGPVATIGDRTIKVGDKVGDYRVTEIDSHGVVLEPSGPK